MISNPERETMLSALCLIASIVSAPPKPTAPVSLHPKNGHYLLFRGKPTILITSGEHYGAVMNLDFDYVKYLDTLHADGLSLTRLFSGAYVENSKAFNIKDNTLAPLSGRYICPWARSETPGYANGGAKFDLTKWDDAYFLRLKDFCSQAGKRGIVVEVVLFCPFYDEGLWHISPMKAGNNINGVGNHTGAEAYTLKHPEITAVQDALVKKITAELAGFDNIYYEICNEPYFGGVTPGRSASRRRGCRTGTSLRRTLPTAPQRSPTLFPKSPSLISIMPTRRMPSR
jgi:hypothetical protein